MLTFTISLPIIDSRCIFSGNHVIRSVAIRSEAKNCETKDRGKLPAILRYVLPPFGRKNSTQDDVLQRFFPLD